MKQLMWGKAPAAIAKKNADGTYKEFKRLPECVENALQLTTTKGEKKEAKVEGGGVEAVKYSKNTYALAMSFRRGMVNGKPIEFPFAEDEVDGVVAGSYYLRVQPEDKTSGGLSVKEVIISTEDTYTSADGAIKVVTFDFIKPEENEDGSQDPTIDWDPIPNLMAPVAPETSNDSGE